MNPPTSRRSFLKTSAALAGRHFLGDLLRADEAAGPLIAYVGTFSSPLRDVLPTQVDLPPGNGRGIHLFQVDRATGAMTAAGVHEMGDKPELPGPERRRNPPVFRQRDRSGGRRARKARSAPSPSTGPTGS